MKKNGGRLFILWGLFFSCLSWADFSKDFETFQKTPPEFSLETIETIKRKNFLFIGGFGSELVSGYFYNNTGVLKKLGVKKYERHFPSSLNPVDVNGASLRNKIPFIFASGGNRPLVIIAHSLGGAVALSAVAQEPGLVTSGMIDRIITVESPVRGSHMGDQANKLLGLLGPLFVGLHSTSSGEIDRAVRQSLNLLSKKDRQIISKRVFYIVASQDPDRLPPEYYALGKIMEEDFNEANDGVVAEVDQWIPGFGTVLAKLKADHTELTFPASGHIVSGTVEGREAFTYAILKNIKTDVRNLNGESSGGELILPPEVRPEPLSRLYLCSRLLQFQGKKHIDVKL